MTTTETLIAAGKTILGSVPKGTPTSTFSRLLIRAIAVMIADEANTKEVEVAKRRDLAAKWVVDIAGPTWAEQGNSAMLEADIARRLQAAVDALVGVGEV